MTGATDTPTAIAQLAVAAVVESTAEQLRVDPEMIAPTLGLTYMGTWDGQHHYTARAEGIGGVRVEP